MKTRDRLTRAYDEARVVPFDDTSRFVFLTDAHRGDGSMSDEFAKNKDIFNAALDHYFVQGFTLVEAGDNDDLWEYPHVRNIVAAHGPTFWRLSAFHRERRYFRLYGNHDVQLRDPDYVRDQFSHAFNSVTGHEEELLPGLQVLDALLFRHAATRQEILLVHGHQGDFSNDQNWRMTMWIFRGFWKHLHAFGIRSPSSPVKNNQKRHKVERNFVKWIRLHHVALICGHTHRWKFPNGDDLPYFNTGACSFPGYVTGLELADGSLTLVRWHVEPDEAGYLRVARRIMAGPRPVGDFDLRG